uniref:Uncharacterized protein n=1 Tax=viral metagenome TaxID=1070528 RepID=A0A6M3LG97_9ZZZZ
MKTCDECGKRKVRYTIRQAGAKRNLQTGKWEDPAERYCNQHKPQQQGKTNA